MAANQTAAGLVLIALSGVAATAVNAIVKAVGDAGLPVQFMLAVAAALTGAVLLAALALRRAEPPARHLWGWLLLRGCAAAGYILLTSSAVLAGAPIGDVSALMGLSNLLAALLGRCLLGESLRWGLALPALVLSLAGTPLIVRPAFLFGGSLPAGAVLGYALALCAAACQSFLFISARKLAGMPSLFQAVSTYVCSVLASSILGFAQREPALTAQLSPEELQQAALWVLAILASLLALGPLQSKGATLCPAALSATASMTARVVCGYLADVVLFGSRLHWLPALGGALLIASSGALVLARPRGQEGLEEQQGRAAAGAGRAQDQEAAAGVEQRFVISELRAEDLDAVLELEAKVMTGQNPMVRATGLLPSEFRQMSEADAAGWVESGCSLVMRDTQADGAIVAFALCERVGPCWGSMGVSSLEQKFATREPSTRVIFQLARRTMASAAPHPDLNVSSWLTGQLLRFCVGGTLPEYEGLGLQSRLRKRVLALAVERGFRCMIVRTANPATEHLWQKYGCTELASLTSEETGLFPPGFQEKFTLVQKVLRPHPLLDSSAAQVLARVLLSLRRRDAVLLPRPKRRNEDSRPVEPAGLAAPLPALLTSKGATRKGCKGDVAMTVCV